MNCFNVHYRHWLSSSPKHRPFGLICLIHLGMLIFLHGGSLECAERTAEVILSDMEVFIAFSFLSTEAIIVQQFVFRTPESPASFISFGNRDKYIFCRTWNSSLRNCNYLSGSSSSRSFCFFPNISASINLFLFPPFCCFLRHHCFLTFS